ncbi:MAG: bifunctional folylpolyglutamate synthase/dihydrofolate synthase [Clostridia bacterium]|nr:bifunctional folylpolyglutamate synthase/dihydrofolate synthase [Clostridia bacterium]
MTYNEAVEKINSLLVFGAKPGLERISELAKRIGSPDKKLKFVHAAGTNGKGSTCSLIASALTEAGFKTGLFISPYVLEFRERFMIDGEMIPHGTLADIVERLFPVIEEMKAEGKIITEFEFVLAVALKWYEEENCDFVVLETGLGGRFDATNIIDTPLVSVITSISLDHTKILGNTYDKIAFEKCGIIKNNGITVAYADQKPEAMEVIRTAAEERHNKLYVADPSEAQIIRSDIRGTHFRFVSDHHPLEITIGLIGEHQVKNAVTALYAIKALRERGTNIPDSAVINGFRKVRFPARLELLNEKPIIFLDGAHNPDGAAALAGALKKYLGGKRLIGIVGMLADKDVSSALSVLLPLFDEVVTTAPDNPRKMSPEDLAELVKSYCTKVHPENDHEKAYRKALSLTGESDALIIFGSLYLASDMRRIITANNL